MDLHFTIEDEAVFVELLKKVDAEDSADLINAALNLLSWFCKQESKGRSVASMSDGKVCRIVKLKDGKFILAKGEGDN